MSDIETLKEEIKRLIGDSLKEHVGKRKVSIAAVYDAAALYKRQLEELGCTNVMVTPSFVHDEIDIEARFTPPAK